MTASEPAQSFDLRPLGIGEIVDRAVTIFVRNFVMFCIIAAFVTIPVAIAGYFAALGSAGALESILKQVQHPTPASQAFPAIAPWYFLVIVASLLLTPFMYVAIGSAVGQLYASRTSDWKEAYAVALRHAGAILMLVLTAVFVYIAVVLGGAIVFGIGGGIAAVVVQVQPAVGILLIVLLLPLALAYVIVFMLCYLAMALAFQAIGIEEMSFGSALRASFARVFNRRELGRSALICLVFVALEIALMLLSGAVSLALGATHQLLIVQVFQAVLSLIATGFMGVLIAVYYYDVRIRFEGLDLHAQIDALQTTPQT